MNDENDDNVSRRTSKIHEISAVVTEENTIVSTKESHEHERKNYKIIRKGLFYGARIAFAVWKAKRKIK